MAHGFTERADQVILQAQVQQKGLMHSEVRPTHILLGLLSLVEGTAHGFFLAKRIDLAMVRRLAVESMPVGNAKMLLGEAPFIPEAKKVLELALEESQSFNHGLVGTEHILLGLLRVDESAALLAKAGMTHEFYRKLVSELPSK